MKSWEEILKILAKEIDQWVHEAVALLPNFIIALLILFIFIFLASLLYRVVCRILNRVSDNPAVNSLLSSATYFLILSIGIFMALGVLKLDKTVTSLLAGAGVIGIALGFAFQEIASNFIAGVFIAFMKPFRVGDIIEIDRYVGTIIRINIRSTSLMMGDQSEVSIPNKDMFTKTFVNYTTTAKRKVSVKCGVSYKEDLHRVREVALKALEGVCHRTMDEASVQFSEFGDSSVNFNAEVWIEYPGSGNFGRAKDDMIVRLKEAFDREGISIPYPVRTLDFPKDQFIKSMME